MAKINNKKGYKITPVTAEDLLLGTQLTTGNTSNFQEVLLQRTLL